MNQAVQAIDSVIANVERVIVGKRTEVELAVVGLLAQGHVLIEDVPGVGKTMLARSIARSVGCDFKRIQFTPDLLPSDVTGVSIYNQKTGEFYFHAGPIMAQIVLADEINRATPKTQSALLECMEERQMTVDGVTYRMPDPFMVMATQNPIEYEGTFPLPEAQVDRFLLRLSLGYPSRQQEIAILEQQQRTHPIDDLVQVIDTEQVRRLQQQVREVYVDPLVRDYIVGLAEATRQHPDVYLGASPRGSLALFRAAQALALIRGRDFVTPDDIKHLVRPALVHRVIVGPAARMRNVKAEGIVVELMESIPIPGIRRGVAR
ncbi:MAG: MoxR family ATPase [Chloroflexota bacterium]|nr:MAG: MoxR family ATPase [Chloroflexota bacterium]